MHLQRHRVGCDPGSQKWKHILFEMLEHLFACHIFKVFPA
jgi:hypothetical protein